jgi:fructose-1-phosphate kinase PfkB-like protein
VATIITLTPNTLLDYVALAAITAGKINRVDAFKAAAGGKGVNVGRVLARHGHRVLAMGFSGGATGAMLSDLIEADGMEPTLTPTAARTRVGFIAVRPEGGFTSVIEHGFEVTRAEIGRLIKQLRVALASADLVIVGGSVPSQTCDGMFRLVLDACYLAKVPCWIDSYGEAMEQALTHRRAPLLVKPNREEYGRGRKWVKCQELHLTDGHREIRVRHPEGRYRVTPPSVKELNGVGSGDCYLAGLAHARLSGMPLRDQLAYAAAAGAANAARSDMACIKPRDIEALLDDVRITPLNGAGF